MFYFIPDFLKWLYGQKEQKETELLPDPTETLPYGIS